MLFNLCVSYWLSIICESQLPPIPLFRITNANIPRYCFSGTKRFDSEKAGDREVQRTMLELLNQMDGFMPTMQVKVILLCDC